MNATLQRIAIGIEYDGSRFCGWQQQAQGASIERELVAAISRVADHPIEVCAAGRTDAGVHALGQVVHFDTTALRTARGWLLGITSRLPDDVTLIWARPVAEDFHARSSAVARSYTYRILNRPTRPALARHRACWWREALDAECMHHAAQQLCGEHDFSAFRAAECQSKSAVRRLYRIDVTRTADLVTIEVTANAFLHHMVRNIAGALLAVGSGKRPESWLAGILAGRDRRHGGITAPAGGLYLARVHYPPHFGIPVAGTGCSDIIAGAMAPPPGTRA
jgi:tRNA pseudouridine38-40 synthase